MSYKYNFNPRSREGSDVQSVDVFAGKKISIRAPARGATRSYARSIKAFLFQSALPRGERLKELIDFGADN